MKREILFKAKRIDNNELVYGSLIVYSITKDGKEKQYAIKLQDAYNTDLDTYRVIPETVSQFTGLTDKNGVKIFENDFVLVKNKPYESKDAIIVVWGKKSYGWSLKFNCGDHYEHKPLIKYYSLPSSKNIEVIGNIYE